MGNPSVNAADERAVKKMPGGDRYGTTLCGREMDFAGHYPTTEVDLPWRLCDRCERKSA